MATLRNKRKLAAASRETQEHSRNSQLQNTSVPGITEEYITQVFEEIEGRVIKKLSHELSRKESCILGALSKLDEFLLNPQVRTLSGIFPGTSRNHDVENRKPTGIVPRVIPIPKWSSLSVGRAIQLTQTRKRPLTETQIHILRECSSFRNIHYNGKKVGCSGQIERLN